MANYFNAGIAPVPFLADEDLTGWQYRVVMAASIVGKVQKFDILITETCPRVALGVLQNDPSAGQEASVKMIGFTKVLGVVGGCYLSHGVMLAGSNGGALVAASADGDEPSYGIWLGPNATTGCVYGNALVNFSMARTGSTLAYLAVIN